MRYLARMRRRLRAHQTLTLTLLTIGYTGYYLCRSNLSIAMPELIDELAAAGLSPDDARVRLGTMASLGVLAYALGKLFFGGTADLLGGRRNFLAGMGGAVVFTLLFSAGGGLSLFTLAWIGNRTVQSIGWAGTVKIASRWFSYSRYATVMGVVSLSYLFGDGVARLAMSALIAHGFGWRAVFRFAAAGLAALFALTWALLAESREERGFPPPDPHPDNLFRDADGAAPRLADVLGPLLHDPTFWVVCALSLGCTLVRETFNTWTPTYFHQAIGFDVGRAAAVSALFPFVGGVSVVASGLVGDRIGDRGRAWVIVLGLLVVTTALASLSALPSDASPTATVAIVLIVAAALLGPYSYLAGAVALDLGGRRGSATASGIIDGVGYLGAVLAGDSVARVSVAFGWSGAFRALAGVAALTTVAAGALLVVRRR